MVARPTMRFEVKGGFDNRGTDTGFIRNKVISVHWERQGTQGRHGNRGDKGSAQEVRGLRRYRRGKKGREEYKGRQICGSRTA